MGCFLGCFGGAKERRCRRKRSPAQSPNGRARAAPRASQKKVDLYGEAVSAAVPLLGELLELRDSSDDLCLAVVKKKKKVMFDPNVTTYDYEPAAIPEDDSEGADPEEDTVSGEEDWMLAPEFAKSEAFPLDHRYGNCANCEYEDDEDEEDGDDDDEYEDCYEQEDGLDECAVDDEGEEQGLLGIARGEEEACESLFLLPISKVTKGQETASGVTAARDRSEQASHVLSSVENLTRRKEPKPRAAPAPKSSDKENAVLGQDNPVDLLAEPAISTKKEEENPAVSDFSYSPSTPSKHEAASVDASLSTWLRRSSATPQSNSVRSYSPVSREDRPILGALTMEDIKISSANSSPVRSRSTSPSPHDMPILGTVGVYWNCSAKGDNAVTRGGFMKTRTRFGQDDAVNCY